jgi:NADH:ubiquinone oxidoreductase subunit E
MNPAIAGNAELVINNAEKCSAESTQVMKIDDSTKMAVNPDAFVENCIKNNGSFLIPILESVQEYYKYLPEDVLKVVARKLNKPYIDVYGVATFYQAFSLKPKGKHVITTCLGTACYVRGGSKIVDSISKQLKIKQGETTPDMKFTLETVNCLGCCAIGPTVVIDGKFHGEMNSKKVLNLLKKLETSDK